MFLKTSMTIATGFIDLTSKRLIDARFRSGILNLCEFERKEGLKVQLDGVKQLLQITAEARNIYHNHIDESYIILSYSWLETYLSEIEELLYLNDPRSLGDNIPIKLGKILETNSILELIHDVAKRRTKEKSSWGLKGRLKDLIENFGIEICFDQEKVEYISSIRNNIVHNKRIGEIVIKDGKIEYKYLHKDKKEIDVEEYLSEVFNLIIEIYLKTSKYLGINNHYKMHKRNKEFFKIIKDSYASILKADIKESSITESSSPSMAQTMLEISQEKTAT